MLACTRRSPWGPSLFVALFCAGWAGAVAPEMKDAGKFFSDAAIKDANQEIRDIARKYDRDLLIETFATIPGEQAKRVKEMTPEERAKFFRNWATDRAESAVVRGVYILICREPPFLEFRVTAKGRQAFDHEATDKLRNLLLKAFRDKRYDEGLQTTVNFVRERFAAAAAK